MLWTSATPKCEEAITAIKAVLAQQDAEAHLQAVADFGQLRLQEPVAWTLTEELEKRQTTTKAHLWFSNPVNCMWTPLYTSPPKRQPLTDAQIWQLVNDCSFNRDLHADKFARAIEQAHGIGDKT